MRRLTGLWPALENNPGLAAIPAYWKLDCGEDYPLLGPFLRPTERVGPCYPCPHPAQGYCPRSIFEFDDGEYVAVCRDPWTRCQDLPLTRKNVLLYRLDVAAFTKALARPLGVRWHEPEQKAHSAWAFGVRAVRAGLALPTYLVCSPTDEVFHQTVRDLLLASPCAFLLVAPTSRRITAALLEQLAARRSEFVPLEDAVGVNDSGQFAPLLPVASGEELPTPVNQRRRVVNEFKERFGYTVDVICQDAQVHRSDFYKWLRGELPDHLGKSKRIEDLLRSDPSQRVGR